MGFTNTQPYLIGKLVSRHSNFVRLSRIVAYIFRFFHNLQNKLELRLNGELKDVEVSKARNFLLSHAAGSLQKRTN